MTERTFEIAGTSVLDGQLTYRFANGSLSRRVATLTRGGHEEVSLFALPRPMTVAQAQTYLRRKGIKNAAMPVRGRRPAAGSDQRKAA